MFKKEQKKNKGFTLVEALIAIAILMISVAAPLSLAAKGLEAASLAKKQIVAYYLAQDAFEWVENKVRYNGEAYSSATRIVEDFDNCVSGNKCIIDTSDAVDESPELYGSQKLKFYNSTGFYGYNDGSNSLFTRYVEIKEHKSDENGNYDNSGSYTEEITVTVTVKWKLPYASEQSYVLKSNITIW